ncbi:MAG: hypothetical protein JWL85_248 [Candidatus Saccharibacteria bacterium]|nr:hypothetical protein [Candidatus Saccharibacteria bacterium]
MTDIRSFTKSTTWGILVIYMKKIAKKIRLFLIANKKWTLILVGAVLLIGGSGTAYALVVQRPKPLAIVEMKQVETKPVEDTLVPAPVTSTPTTAPVTQTPQPTSQPKSKATATNPGSNAAGPPSATKQPFLIASVYLNGASWYCSGGRVVLQVASAGVSAQNIAAGGAFTWQVELVGTYNDPVPYAYSAHFPSTSGGYTITGSSPGYLYSGVLSSAVPVTDVKIRVRVVTPNSVTSSWYVVPASAFNSCS